MKDERDFDDEPVFSLTRTEIRKFSDFFSVITEHKTFDQRKNHCVGREITYTFKVCDVKIEIEKTRSSSGCRLNPRKPQLTRGESYCFCNETGLPIKFRFKGIRPFGTDEELFRVDESRSLEVTESSSTAYVDCSFEILWKHAVDGWQACSGVGNGAHMGIDNP